MDLTTDKLRSLVRKWQTLIEATVDVKTTDGYFLRLFCISFTKKRPGQVKKTAYAQSSQVRDWVVPETVWERQVGAVEAGAGEREGGGPQAHAAGRQSQSSPPLPCSPLTCAPLTCLLSCCPSGLPPDPHDPQEDGGDHDPRGHLLRPEGAHCRTVLPQQLMCAGSAGGGACGRAVRLPGDP